MGPRQVGKTTLASQIMGTLDIPCHYVSADEPTFQDRLWLNQQWDIARAKIPSDTKNPSALLIIDEIHKVSGWSETVKRLWDEDSLHQTPLKVILLGSSSLLMQKGLTESLAGRFESIPIGHWSFMEMEACFDYTLDQYIFFGGYPGAAGLIEDVSRWTNYILDSLVETTISKDILQMTRVDKPALLKRLFHLGCLYSGQILSYQKMMGQLQDAGNTTTLAHYLSLLKTAGLLSGLPKYAGDQARRRAASPKLLIHNTGLMTAMLGRSPTQLREDPNTFGRLFESTVGAHLVNTSQQDHIEVSYWLDRNREVDFVLSRGTDVIAIEVKSSQRTQTLPGIAAFNSKFTVKRSLLVGAQGIPLKDFLSVPAGEWFK